MTEPNLLEMDVTQMGPVDLDYHLHLVNKAINDELNADRSPSLALVEHEAAARKQYRIMRGHNWWPKVQNAHNATGRSRLEAWYWRRRPEIIAEVQL